MLKINFVLKRFQFLRLTSNYFARFNNTKINKSMLLNSNNNPTDEANNITEEENTFNDNTQKNLPKNNLK